MRAILIIIAVIVVLIIASWLFWHVLGLLVLALWLAFAAAGCYGLFIFVRTLMGAKKSERNLGNKAEKISYKLWALDQATVSMFITEPSAQQVMLLELNAHETLKSADMVKIPIDTKVTILEDTGKECVKVRLQGSTFPKNVGWVARNSLFKETT